MSISRLRHASFLSTLLRVLVLCFALGTVAHAGHTHELNSSTETHFQCDYCTSFGGLIDAPVMPDVVTHHALATPCIATVSRSSVANVIGLPQARAPPAC
jgi:hypothetical protein